MILFILITTIFIIPNIIYAEEMVSVRLVNDVQNCSKMTIKVKGNYLTSDPTFQLKEGVSYRLKVKKGKFSLEGDGVKLKADSFFLFPDEYDTEHIVYINKRPYLGAMEFTIDENRYIRPINQLPLEDYLKGVVPFEVYPSWELETLKAQTLAARTYAVSYLNSKMDDTISFQVYGGYDWNPNTTKAVEETRGEVITYNNKLIDAFYSASNGGMTENNAHVWGGKALPVYPIKKDPFDPGNPWELTIQKSQIDFNNINWDYSNWWDEFEEKDPNVALNMQKWFQNHGYTGDIKILSIPAFKLADEKNKSNRSLKGSITIKFMERLFDGTIVFHKKSFEDIPLNRIRPMIGGSLFKSYLIDSLSNDDQHYTIRGKGYGHGVGMSQWGASMMGEQGRTYKEIIQFYFPGTTISNITKRN